VNYTVPRWLSISATPSLVCGGAIGLVLVSRRCTSMPAQGAERSQGGPLGKNWHRSPAERAGFFRVPFPNRGTPYFKVQASKAVQFKQGSRVELHDVTITLYGRDSSRFDQIYGADFDMTRNPRWLSGEAKSRWIGSDPKAAPSRSGALPKERRTPSTSPPQPALQTRRLGTPPPGQSGVQHPGRPTDQHRPRLCG